MLEVGPQHRVEEPRADDVVRLRAQVHREQRARTGRDRPPSRAAIWGVSDEVAHVSMTSGSPTNPPGSPRWSAEYPGGTSSWGSIGSAASSAQDRVRRSRARPARRAGYHTGNGTPKYRCRLTAQSLVQPLDPARVARAHERRMPRDLAPTREQRLLERQRLHEPLPARDHLERAIALLVELHDVLDGLGLAHEPARLAEQLDDAASAPASRPCPASSAIAAFAASASRDSHPGSPNRPAPIVPSRRNDHARGQPELPPPDDVGDVAERADLRGAGPLLGVGELVRDDRHGHAEQRA